MLQRQVEPELMNATAQVEAYAAGDFSQSDQALVAWITHRFPAGLGNRVIDLGCGIQHQAGLVATTAKKGSPLPPIQPITPLAWVSSAISSG